MSERRYKFPGGTPHHLWVWVAHWWMCGGEGSRRRLKSWDKLTEPELIRFRAACAEIEEICAMSQVGAGAPPRSTRPKKEKANG